MAPAKTKHTTVTQESPSLPLQQENTEPLQKKLKKNWKIIQTLDQPLQ